MAKTRDALYMHCLPADIGAEVTHVLEAGVDLAREANKKVYVIMVLWPRPACEWLMKSPSKVDVHLDKASELAEIPSLAVPRSARSRPHPGHACSRPWTATAAINVVNDEGPAPGAEGDPRHAARRAPRTLASTSTATGSGSRRRGSRTDAPRRGASPTSTATPTRARPSTSGQSKIRGGIDCYDGWTDHEVVNCEFLRRCGWLLPRRVGADCGVGLAAAPLSSSRRGEPGGRDQYSAGRRAHRRTRLRAGRDGDRGRQRRRRAHVPDDVKCRRPPVPASPTRCCSPGHWWM